MLKFLQVTNKRVAAPTTGHVRTDDLSDAMINVSYGLLEEGAPDLFARLGGTLPSGSQPAGLTSPSSTTDPDPIAQIRALYRGGRPRPGQGFNPARGINPNRRPHRGCGFLSPPSPAITRHNGNRT